jgi:hypothetical protein
VIGKALAARASGSTRLEIAEGDGITQALDARDAVLASVRDSPCIR